MFVKPAENPDQPGTLLRVRIPVSFLLLSDEGAEVPEDGFWLQRLAQGDVVKADRPEEAAPEPPPDAPTDASADAPAAEPPKTSEGEAP